MTLRKLFLVRHAHSVWSPDEQRSLSPSGILQAECVADILTEYPISAIVSSPYRRARKTVEPLAQRLHLPICSDKRLRERRVSTKFVDDFPMAMFTLWNNPGRALPGGESNETAQKRGMEFITSILNQAYANQPYIVVATHGNLMALILQSYFPCIDYAFWANLSCPDIYELTIQDRQQTAEEGIDILGTHITETTKYPVRLWHETGE